MTPSGGSDVSFQPDAGMWPVSVAEIGPMMLNRVNARILPTSDGTLEMRMPRQLISAAASNVPSGPAYAMPWPPTAWPTAKCGTPSNSSCAQSMTPQTSCVIQSDMRMSAFSGSDFMPERPVPR